MCVCFDSIQPSYTNLENVKREIHIFDSQQRSHCRRFSATKINSRFKRFDTTFEEVVIHDIHELFRKDCTFSNLYHLETLCFTSSLVMSRNLLTTAIITDYLLYNIWKYVTIL